MQLEHEWYPGKINPHPLGSAPERFEPAISTKERLQRDREDALRLQSLNEQLASVSIRISAMRAARDEQGGAIHAARNVQYVQLLNKHVELKEQIEQMFKEQEQ